MQSNDCMNQDDNPYAASPSLTSQAGVAPNDTVAFGEFNPFRAIWIAPRKTIRRIVDADPSLHVVLLACLAGIGRALDRASMRNAGDKEPFVAIIASAFVFGPLGGLLSVWIGSHLIRWSGKWIGGTGSRPHIKAAIAWASVPAAFALPLWIPALAMFGPEMFTEEIPTLDDEPQMLIPFMAFAVAEVVLGVWALVLLCNTVTEVQGFKSAWAGLVNLVLAGAVILVPILVIGFGLVVASRA